MATTPAATGGVSAGKQGPPPIVKKVLSLFGSQREEDKMVGYLAFLKVCHCFFGMFIAPSVISNAHSLHTCQGEIPNGLDTNHSSATVSITATPMNRSQAEE
jgi:hypothetical protein